MFPGPRSIAFDGQYAYITSSSLKCLLKLGTGKQGTIRGMVYVSREVDPGWVVWLGGRLLQRKMVADEEKEGGEEFCTLLDCNTLEVRRGRCVCVEGM